MADKKIIWKQKTGASTFDVLLPQTTADQVLYNDSTVAEALDNIGTDLDKKFVTLDTRQTIAGDKLFGATVQFEGLTEFYGDVRFANRALTVNGEEDELQIILPSKSGDLALVEDIPNLSRTIGGSGNAVTDITVSGHSITVTKGTTFATTATATQSTSGLMSSTDKKNLDDMVTLFGTTSGDSDKIVNTVRELLALFDQYPEGTTITEALAGKADKSALNDYVTLNTEQSIKAEKDFTRGIRVFGHYSGDSGGILLDNGGNDIPDTRIVNEGLIRTWADWDAPVQIYFPIKSGDLALVSDITWEKLTGRPSSLPPTGKAGGDLADTYPNPTIAPKAVTTYKLADLAVTSDKLSIAAVTTTKISDGNVTNQKLDDTTITNYIQQGNDTATFSVLTVNKKGRVTAGANLFTIGTSSSIPSSVPTNGFYLQQV